MGTLNRFWIRRLELALQRAEDLSEFDGIMHEIKRRQMIEEKQKRDRLCREAIKKGTRVGGIRGDYYFWKDDCHGPF